MPICSLMVRLSFVQIYISFIKPLVQVLAEKVEEAKINNKWLTVAVRSDYEFRQCNKTQLQLYL